MTIPRHSFPAALKIRSEIVRSYAEPALQSFSQVMLGGRKEAGRASGAFEEIDLHDQRLANRKIPHTWKDTFGECLPGLLIETVIDQKCTNRLALCTSNSKLIAKR